MILMGSVRAAKAILVEEPMKSNLWRTAADRRVFIGGSDARIIMANDEASLIQLWREKRGEAGPEDLSRNLVVQLGGRHGGAQPLLVRA